MHQQEHELVASCLRSNGDSKPTVGTARRKWLHRLHHQASSIKHHSVSRCIHRLVAALQKQPSQLVRRISIRNHQARLTSCRIMARNGPWKETECVPDRHRRLQTVMFQDVDNLMRFRRMFQGIYLMYAAPCITTIIGTDFTIILTVKVIT